MAAIVNLIIQIYTELTEAAIKTIQFSWHWLFDTAELHLWLAPYLFFLIIERIIGRQQRATREEVTHNFAFLITWVFVFVLVNPILTRGVSWSKHHTGGPYLDLTFETNNKIIPNILALFIYFFIYDFFSYWWHRLQHTFPFLWVTHKLHHTDKNLGVTTTMKEHPISFICRTLIIALPMNILFSLTPVTIFWVAYSVRLYGHFIHTNIDCHFGWLNRILTSPNQHRLHHSLLPEHRDKNFATYFSIIDVIFGTYLPPGKIEAPTGLDSGETYPSIWSAYTQPFHDWSNMIKEWRERRT